MAQQSLPWTLDAAALNDKADVDPSEGPTKDIGVPMKTVYSCLVLFAFPVLAEAQDWTSVSPLFEDQRVLCHSG